MQPFSRMLAVGVVLAIAFCAHSADGQKKKPTKPKKIAGGANQVEGLNGTIGQMLFTGRWRFQDKEVKEVDTYTLKVPTSEQDYGRYHTFAEMDDATKTSNGKAMWEARTWAPRNMTVYRSSWMWAP